MVLSNANHVAYIYAELTRLGAMEDLDDGEAEVGERGKRAAADVDVRLDVEVLEADLDLGQHDADAVDALAELEQESLIVLLREAQQLGDDLLAVVVAEVAHVNLLLRHLAVRPNVLHDGRAHTVVRRQLLQRRPLERLLIVLRIALRRRPREHVLARRA